MKILRLLTLFVCATSLFAADTTINRLRLQSDANGAGTNDWYAIETYGGKNLSLTNGQFTLQTNSQMTTTGGTNDNRGIASGLIGRVSSTNGANVVTGPASLLIGNASGIAGGFASNAIVATGAANLMVVDNVNSKASTNEAVISGASAGNLMVGSFTTAVGAAANGQIEMGDAKGIVLAFRSSWKGSNFVTGSGSVVSYAGTQGTNTISGVGSVIAYDTDGGFTDVGASFSVASIYTADGGKNTLDGSVASGGLKSMFADGGTNEIHGGGISVLRAEASSVLIDSKHSGLVTAHALNGTTVTVGAVEGAVLLSVTDTLYGSSSVTGKGGALIGSGTNALPYTTVIGYGGKWLSIRTNGYHSISHLEAADATVDWPQGTNVYIGRVTLPAGSQSVFITNAVVTTASVVVSTVNSDDTTAITVKAIPTAGQLQLKAVAAATADTLISWHILAP